MIYYLQLIILTSNSLKETSKLNGLCKSRLREKQCHETNSSTDTKWYKL